MAPLTQNSGKILTNAVISIILTNVNNAVSFYRYAPNTGMSISLEETIRENLPFAELVANQSPAGRWLLTKLKKMNDDVIDRKLIEHLELPTYTEAK
jgi:hypothetical protein